MSEIGGGGTGRSGPVSVAVIGAGNISSQYLRNLTRFPDLKVVAIADLDVERAAAAAAEFGVPASGPVAEILALPEVELVVNLTIPAAHAEVALAAVSAGKHVYGEKPLALDPAAARSVLTEAAARGVRVGNAPDTFLGAGLQSALRAVTSGLIGTPVAANAAFQSPGPESWHPSPEFLFAHGAGPLFDMGPYYLTALVSLLGPVGAVAASGHKARESRVIGSGPKAGTAFPVEVPTHVMALLEFRGGAGATTTFSFDSPLSRQSIEITGTEGTLLVPDPNQFDGNLRLRRPGVQEAEEIPATGTDIGRGIGVLDMARALRTGAAHRASGDLALHVLDVMTAIAASAQGAAFLDVPAWTEKLEALPEGWDPLEATL
ncbi:oxidoreductase domain protein [Catenulispora acidiphila DSM 44928]|uniref:Oxidoreductase domain protein n=1 Tax=Catenulispora acidiphila (strain DSM 44928 / JCM 14897 / NBRC 102108 / NRRL B-24433 / ID139908) TaxID=479433 RepID=C7Q832_CATAD|nr:Gfo/Idh/MocA family oxidoreductase [Catenulispora acidiphila]ACU74199.1 oxidoreductase domain protein [Catenulispora acidiphila DSM 44928]